MHKNSVRLNSKRKYIQRFQNSSQALCNIYKVQLKFDQKNEQKNFETCKDQQYTPDYDKILWDGVGDFNVSTDTTISPLSYMSDDMISERQ